MLRFQQITNFKLKSKDKKAIQCENCLHILILPGEEQACWACCSCRRRRRGARRRRRPRSDSRPRRLHLPGGASSSPWAPSSPRPHRTTECRARWRPALQVGRTVMCSHVKTAFPLFYDSAGIKQLVRPMDVRSFSGSSQTKPFKFSLLVTCEVN